VAWNYKVHGKFYRRARFSIRQACDVAFVAAFVPDLRPNL
jgi:hypothetical protein